MSLPVPQNHQAPVILIGEIDMHDINVAFPGGTAQQQNNINFGPVGSENNNATSFNFDVHHHFFGAV